MTQEVKVHLDAMTRYVKELEQLSESFTGVRQRLNDADVTSDSFGMLAESRETAGVYEQRTTDGFEVLKAGEGVFDELAQAFKQMRDNYQHSDQASSDGFEAINGFGGTDGFGGTR
jgi:hypothetical protein